MSGSKQLEGTAAPDVDEGGHDGRSRGSHPVGITHTYQPALDGVRAIAVAMVFMLHVGVPWMLRGGAGVDMFFVLSGYLITSLLISERASRGRIDLRSFYARRVLRLAPLAILVTLFCLAVNEAGLAGDWDLHVTRGAALSVLFYFANWWGIAHPLDFGPLGPMWSLSIEEQFYLLWPPAVVAVFALARRHARALLVVVVIAVLLVNGVVRQHLYDTALEEVTATGAMPELALHLLFNSFLRPDGLFVGCLAALVLAGRVEPHRFRRVIRWLGVAGIAIACAALAGPTPPVDVMLLPPLPPWSLSLFNIGVACTIVWLVVERDSPLARLLSLRPLVWVGRRSYGIYVLHLIVIRVIRSQWSLEVGTMVVVAAASTLVVAGLCYRFVETPFLRLKERFAGP